MSTPSSLDLGRQVVAFTEVGLYTVRNGRIAQEEFLYLTPES